MLRLRSCVLFSAALLLPFLAGCQRGPGLKIAFDQYELDNGLQVVLHEDRSDPIVSVAILFHVGSGREEVGRTGFAHLFEHMMFQSSQHVAEDQFFQKIQVAGGTLNGGTSQDLTIYFEILPKNALEMALWLESDRMGFLLPMVTQEAFLNQQGVVQNEKRENYDNRPYGQTGYVIGKLLYPEGHAYNWQVIGSLEDLGNATVEDVIEFFRTWYGPNNATLVIAGDFDPAQTREWVEKYFGEIESRGAVTDPTPQRVTLSETKRAFYEDNFARSPELNMVFPTVEEYSPDSYALTYLGQLLSDGKDAPLYKVIVEEKELAPAASASQQSLEVAGDFSIRVRTFPQISLADVEAAIQEAFALFEEEGFTEEDLERIKASTETGFYNAISSVMFKSFQLAMYNEFAGSPGYITEHIAALLAVTPEDVWRVYEQYLKDKPFVLTSWVPRGQTDLVAEGSELFVIAEESIETAGAGLGEGEAAGVAVAEIPSSFDRSVEPARGPAPEVVVPQVWTHTYANGLRLYGIEHNELPLLQYSLTIDGGTLLDDIDKVGVANLMTDIMMEGTVNKTPLELEEAIDALGASISMSTGRQSIAIRANGLKSKAAQIYGLFEEILLEPRWDEDELPRLKDETVETINRGKVNPAGVASAVFSKLVYGQNSILGESTLGTPESVESIGMDDLRAFYAANYSPSVSYLTVAGDISQAEAIELFRPLEERWAAKDVADPAYPEPTPQPGTAIYFVDIPGARQSVIYVGHLGSPRTHPDFFASTVMNYQLGGNFASVLNMILREEKGFTYGAGSSFSEGRYPGMLRAWSGVQSNATRESLEIFRDEIARYREGVSEETLTYTRDAMALSYARQFETLGDLLGMLDEIAAYDLPFDFVEEEQAVIRNMTLERHQALAQQYLDTEHMIYLVVGDAQTQIPELQGLGLGNPILLDTDGNRLR